MDVDDRERWARTLTTAGWLALLAYLSVVTVQVNRARQTTQTRFDDGVWGLRLEQLSFAALPQNLVVLVPAAAAAVMAALLARGTVAELEVWLDRLVRAVAGTAIVAVALAGIGIVAGIVGVGSAGSDFSYLINRLGGIALATAVVRVCLLVERSRQTPSSPSR